MNELDAMRDFYEKTMYLKCIGRTIWNRVRKIERDGGSLTSQQVDEINRKAKLAWDSVHNN